MDDVTAFVLAGGRSSRMGADKALLPWGDENLLRVALRKVSAVCPEPIIVGDPERYSSFGPAIVDQYAGCGPLGGIQAALSTSQSGWNLIVAVDLPLVTTNFLQWLVQIAQACPAFAVVPVVDGRSQPLCALYRRELLSTVETALQSGEYKVDRVFQSVPCRRVAEDELGAAGFDVSLFRNVNTPQEYEAARHAAGTIDIPDRVR